jgi:acyl dehydratase
MAVERGVATLSLDMVGDATPLTPVNWDERDIMLYALGVGAGQADPLGDLQFTTENSRGVQLMTVPSYINLLTHRLPPSLARMDRGPFLHGEQRLTLARPVPTAGPAYSRSVVEAVFDKGRDGLAVVRGELFADPEAMAPIGEIHATLYVRGAGGFGGPRGSAPDWSVPSRAPDARRMQQTRTDQALLYRLSGDRHRLHSDPAFARENGFERPILHGLCTFGFACRALMEVLCEDDPARLLTMSGRFAHPVYPGDTLVTEVWLAAAERALFRVTGPGGQVVLDRGEATIRAAA